MAGTGLVQIIEGALLAAGKPLTMAQLGELFETHERPDPAAIKAVTMAADRRMPRYASARSSEKMTTRNPSTKAIDVMIKARPTSFIASRSAFS